MTPPKRYRIERLAFGGDGVARDEGKVVFVPGCVPGELVSAEILRRTPRCDFARLVEVLEPSPEHIEGASLPGAVYSHMAYGVELAAKREQLEWFLKRSVDEVHGAQSIEGYRNKVVLRSNGRGALGYCQGSRAEILDLPCDPLAHPAINDCLSRLRSQPGFAASFKAGSTLTLRHTPHDGVLFWRDRSAPSVRLTEATPIGPMLVRSDGFWQVNPVQADTLFRTVSRHFPGGETLLDLYCGAGVFGLILSSRFRRVIGVETSPEAVADARLNAQAYGVEATYLCGDCARLARRLLREHPGASVLVDPPRAGLAHDVLDALLEAEPPCIGYVSCGPDTLARDWRRLSTRYRIARAELVDLFPRTQHFETFLSLQPLAPKL